MMSKEFFVFRGKKRVDDVLHRPVEIAANCGHKYSIQVRKADTTIIIKTPCC
jgi:hypothetical protein